MQRNRTILSLVVGLALLVQGVSAVAASCVAHAEPATPVEATDEHAEMPCHEPASDPAVDHDTSSTDDPACCGADCPNTATCASGYAAVVHGFPLNVECSPDTVSNQISVDPLTQPPPVLLRPPIVLHG